MRVSRFLVLSCVVIILSAIVCPFLVYGQIAPDPNSPNPFSPATAVPLSWCIRTAIKHNLRAKIASNDLRASELARDEFAKTKLPTISLNAGASYAPHTANSGYDPISTNGGEVSGQLEIDQQLYDAGIKGLKSDQLQIDVDKAGIQRRIAERDIQYDVEIAFITLLQSQEELALREETVVQLTRYQTLAKQLSLSGQVGAADLLRAKVELSNAMIARDRSNTAVRIARLALADLIGLGTEDSPVITGSLDTLLSGGVHIEKAVADSAGPLEVQSAQAGFQRNLVDLEITHRELFPTISFQGTTGFLSSVDNLQLPPEERVVPFGFAAGVTLSMPLFTWGASDIRSQEGAVAVQSQRDQVALARRTNALQTSSTSLELQENKTRLAAIDSSLQSAEDAYRLTLAKYAGGGALSLELISAQQLLAETRLSRLEALADIQRSLAKLEQLEAH